MYDTSLLLLLVVDAVVVGAVGAGERDVDVLCWTLLLLVEVVDVLVELWMDVCADGQDV